MAPTPVHASIVTTADTTTTPASASSLLTEVISAGVATTALASGWRTINDPAILLLIAANYRIVKRPDGVGSLMHPVFAYPAGLTGLTSPQVYILGRTRQDRRVDESPVYSPWFRLNNAAGLHLTTITLDATEDQSDTAVKYSHLDEASQGYDPLFFNEFLMFPQVAFGATGGTGTAADGVFYLLMV